MRNALNVFGLLLLTSCASVPQEERPDPWNLKASLYVQQLSMYEFNCPPNIKTIVRSVSELTFWARGCGKQALYACLDKEPAWYLFAKYECTRKGNISKFPTEDAKESPANK